MIYSIQCYVISFCFLMTISRISGGKLEILSKQNHSLSKYLNDILRTQVNTNFTNQSAHIDNKNVHNSLNKFDQKSRFFIDAYNNTVIVSLRKRQHKKTNHKSKKSSKHVQRPLGQLQYDIQSSKSLTGVLQNKVEILQQDAHRFGCCGTNNSIRIHTGLRHTRKAGSNGFTSNHKQKPGSNILSFNNDPTPSEIATVIKTDFQDFHNISEHNKNIIPAHKSGNSLIFDDEALVLGQVNSPVLGSSAATASLADNRTRGESPNITAAPMCSGTQDCHIKRDDSVVNSDTGKNGSYFIAVANNSFTIYNTISTFNLTSFHLTSTIYP